MKTYRLLLLGLSGVRVRDSELLSLGMTLPGFVERGNAIASLPSLGLLTLAALTPRNWEVAYREVDAFDTETLAESIAAEMFDLVALSALTARILDAYALSDALRARGCVTAIGGLHVSALPSEAAEHSDCVVTGEGEACWGTLLSDFEHGHLQHRYPSDSRRAFSLVHAPVPRYDLLDPSKYNRLTLQTTRGCPLDCAFCAASRTISSFKRKPIDLIRRELEAIFRIWPRPFIELADDNTFAGGGAWTHQLIRLLSEYGIHWFTETDISVADDPLLLDELAASGCAQLLIGLESARSAPLRHIDSKDWKLRQFEKYREKTSRIQNRGISVNGCFVLGHDDDDESAFGITRDFVRDLELTEVQITILTPFPGTQLYAQLKSENRLLRPVFWDECTLFDVTYRPARMSPDYLRSSFRWLMQELYSPGESAARKRRFHELQRARMDLAPRASSPQ